VEVVPTNKAKKKVVMKFLEEKIITRFSVPAKITTDNAKAFSSIALNDFYFKYGIILSHLKLLPSMKWVRIIQHQNHYEHYEEDCWGKQEELGQEN
jgi:hypothetical protein